MALLAVGCGDADSQAGPGPRTGAPRSPAPGGGGHAAPELEALLPAAIDGIALTKRSATGAGVFGSDTFSREMTRFLASAGKKPADFRFANARDPSHGLDLETGVFRASGVDAQALRAAIVESSRPGAPGLTTSTSTLAGKRVTRLAYASGSMLYLYEQDDRVFYVGTHSDELAWEVLAVLP